MDLFESLDKGGLDDNVEDEKGTPSVDDMLKEDKPKEKEEELPDDEGEEKDEEKDEDEDEDLDEDEGEEKDEEAEKKRLAKLPDPPEPNEDETLHNRPSYKQLKAEYPDLFKKHPELRAVLFREPEYSKVFPTVKEAKETAEYADNVRQMEQFLMQGDSEVLLKSMQEASPAVLAKFAENLPTTLYNLSQETYVKMTTPIIRNAVILARSHARGIGDKDLWNGLDHIEKFLFGDPRFSLKKEAPKEDPLKDEREKLDKERRDIHVQKARDFEGRVQTRSQGALKRELGRGLDPQNTLTPRMRELLVEQAITEIGGRMSKDNAHLASMNTLWRRASQMGLSAESEEQLVRAWLSRARPLIGPVRRKLLAEIIGRGENREGKDTTPNDGGKLKGRPPRVPVGKERGSTRVPLSRVDPRKVDYSKTSDADILSGKVNLKR